MVELINMRKPLIGVTSGLIFNRDYPWSVGVYGQNHTYLDSVIRAGGSPVALPITQNMGVLDNLVDHLDGLLLSGGNDLNPKLFGADPYPNLLDVDDKRDRAEIRLLKRATERGIPIFAVCRGMQLINITRGGTLYQDIPTDLPGSLNHVLSSDKEDHTYISHKINIERDSQLFKIIGEEEVDVNTNHHQAIKKLGENLVVSARSEDGIIEAIEATDYGFMICIQAHPESLHITAPQWKRAFEAFVEAAAKTALTTA